MDLSRDLALISVAVAGLWLGAGWLVDSACRIARRLGVSELVVGLTVVAIGTSAPEFAVSIDAALRGSSDISLGNVIGSNVFNTGVILGLAAVMSPLAVDRPLVYRDGPLVLVATVLVGLAASDGHVSRPEGLALATGLATYLAVLIARRGPAPVEALSGPFRWYDPLVLVLGLGVVVGSADALVTAASDLARRFGMSEWVIGMTIVAAGTSLPELATSVVAAAKGRGDVSVGNIIGSNLFNLLGVLGLSATIHPLSAGHGVQVGLIVLLGLSLLALALMRSNWQVSRREGWVLLASAAVCYWLDAVL